MRYLPEMVLAGMGFALVCQAGGSRGVGLEADFVLPAEASSISAASNAIVRLVVYNRCSTPVELDSLRPMGLEQFEVSNNPTTRALAGIAFGAYVDQLLVTFRGQGNKSEFRVVPPFPLSDTIAPRSYVGCTLAVPTPAEPGIYDVEFRGVRSPGEPRRGTAPGGALVSVAKLKPVIVKRVTIGPVEPGR